MRAWRPRRATRSASAFAPTDRGPRRFTTTLKYLRASRGRFTYDDHEVPWSVDGPNLEFDLTNLPQYHGTAKFHGGTIKIQNHLPMWGDFTAKFVLDGPRVHLPRIDIRAPGGMACCRTEGVVRKSDHP